jgi:hypothetical protein
MNPFIQTATPGAWKCALAMTVAALALLVSFH